MFCGILCISYRPTINNYFLEIHWNIPFKDINMNTTILQHCIYLSTIYQNKDLARLGKHDQLDWVNNLHFIFIVEM